jgi:hypothetical protein
MRRAPGRDRPGRLGDPAQRREPPVSKVINHYGDEVLKAHRVAA